MLSLPFLIHNNPSYIYSNTIFSFGGSSSYVSETVLSSILKLDGSITKWEASSSSIPKKMFWHNAAYENQNVYILGGCEYPNYSTISTNSVYLGRIENNFIKEWVNMPSFQDPVADGAAINIKDKIYYSGGGNWTGSNYDSPIINNLIKYSTIENSGQLGAWTSAGNLPEGLIGHAMFNISNYLYIIGGIRKVCDNNTTSCYLPTNAVRRATINSQDGSISDWIDTNNPVGEPAYHSMVTRVGDYIVVAGGRGVRLHSPTMYDTVYYAKILPDGNLDTWKLSEGTLPKPTCCAGIASLNDKVYITGGHDGAVYFDSVWMATINDIIGQPEVTPTLTPIPTLIQTPTPTLKNPVVFIPGMFACWNKDVILHEEMATNNQWSIPDFIDVYDGLLASFTNAGYEKGINLYLYCYDWRKNVTENAISLSAYILSDVLFNKPPGTTVDLVGHSMGGLIARATASNYIMPKIDKVITLGSPHTGTTMAYPPWEGADFTNLISWQRVLGELYLRIRSPIYKNQVIAAQTAIPSMQNLLPIYNYLKNEKGFIKSVNNLVWKNNLFPILDLYLPPLLSKLSTIGGKGWDTLKYIKVKQPSEKDKLQGKWVDGEPVSSETTPNGDGTVLIESALIPLSKNIWEITGADHGQLVTEIAGQMKVLQVLGVEGEGQIVYPKKYNRAIVVALGSPAIFSVTDPKGNILNPTDGILVIDKPFDGKYHANLLATSAGPYTLYFGRIAPGDSAWETTQGNFSSSGQTREFIFTTNFNTKGLGANPLVDALSRTKLLKQTIQKSTEKWIAKIVLSNLLDQLGKMIQRMERESGKKLEVYTMTVVKYIDKIIIEAEKKPIGGIVEELRLIKLDVWEYSAKQE